jgi:hypothetical protein
MKHIFLFILTVCFLMIEGCGMPGKVRAAQDLENQGQMTKAIDLYREVLPELNPSQRTEVEARLAKALGEVSGQTLQEGKAALGSGEGLEQYDRAIRVLEAGVKYDDSDKRVASQLSTWRGQRQERSARRQELIARSEVQARKNQWGKALMGLGEALRIQSDPETREKQEKMITARNGYYQGLIEQACKADDWEKASGLLVDFSGQQPAPEAGIVSKLEAAVKEIRKRVICQKAKGLASRKKYFSAYTLVLEAKIPGTEDLLSSLRREGSKFYLERGKKELAGNNLFRAYMAAVKAKALVPQEDEIFKFHRDCEDKVDATLHVQIGIAAFDTPKKEPDMGTEFSDSLISYLNHTRPYGIDIVERSKIDQAIKEKDRNLGQAAQLLGTNLFIVGNVSTLTVDKQQSQREISKRMKVGTDTVPNPQYESNVRQYGANTGNWPSVPAQTIEKERFELIKYKRGEARMQGVMTVSVRIFTTDKGAITQADTFTAEEEAKDVFQDGVPEAGIKDDPLELPTELTMKQNLRNKLVKEVATWVLKNFECRQGRYFVEANAYLDRRETEKAVKALAQGYLYCLRDGISEKDEWFEKIRKQVLFELTESSE